ncbi:hypothetical protein MKX01_014321 [Papaver californicum]|nr:hypothetical protein MKX01_014321 [Papaver californicum]
MVELCLMATSAYPIAFFRQEQGIYKTGKDLGSVVPGTGSRQDGLNLMQHQLEDSRRHMGWSSDYNQYVKLDPAMRRPVLVDVRPDSSATLFNYGIAERYCPKHEKNSQLFMSGSSAAAREGVNFPFPYHLMGLQSLPICLHPQAPQSFLSDEVSLDDVGAFEFHHPSLIYPGSRFYAPNPLSDFVGDLSSDSRLSMHPDGSRVLFNGSGVQMKDLMYIIAEFNLSSTSTKRRELPFLVPHFTRLDMGEAALANVCESPPLKLEAVMVAPAKSPKRTKIKQSPAKTRNSRKAGKEGDMHRRNDLQACESLLSLILGKRQGKTAILSLKKSAPELPQLLTQFSASIAGTGLVVLLSVVFKVLPGRVPFCTSKMLNTGFGFGLVWLSWAVNQLRESVISVSKNPNKLQDEKMMKKVDRSVNQIFFRAATVMAVAVLKIA